MIKLLKLCMFKIIPDYVSEKIKYFFREYAELYAVILLLYLYSSLLGTLMLTLPHNPGVILTSYMGWTIAPILLLSIIFGIISIFIIPGMVKEKIEKRINEYERDQIL